VFAITVFGFACGPSSQGDGNGNGGGVDGGGGGGGGFGDEFADARPAERCDKMDILFVVDDSGSMGEEQTNLASNFPQFIDVLDAYQTEGGDFLDYRVAVTSTGRDVDYTVESPQLPGFPTLPPINQSEDGLNGELVQDCGMTRRWLERSDTNVSSTFACAAELGTSGPSLEMPLRTTELAFTDRMSDGTNAGFLRDDALLAIVILTDEDDCSRNDNNFTIGTTDACDPSQPEIVDTTHYIDWLDNLTGSRGRWATAVIAGPGPGTCTSSFGDAIEARRLKEFVQQTGDNAIFSSICEGDLASSLQDALDTFDEACDNFPPVL
jgi:hypothetical protein